MSRDSKVAMLIRQAGELHEHGEYLRAMAKLDEAMAHLAEARKERFKTIFGQLEKGDSQ